MSGRVLVTGANGCIGAWVIRQFLADGEEVVALDAGDDDHRLRMILHGVEQRGKLEKVRADIRDLDGLKRLVRDREVDRVIHLAALQVPFARANPPLGAAVNVVGTVNLFEAVKGTPAAERPLVYASSVAVYQPSGGGPRDGLPDTHYGVYKRANEGNARIFWRDDGLASIGLRPHVVYGVGRDQGLTSSPTVAMLHAAAGRGYRIPYGGASQLHFTEDVAAIFVAAARAQYEGALVADLAGPSVHMADIVAAIAGAAGPLEPAPSFEDTPLPFPGEVHDGDLEAVIGPLPRTPLDEGVARTIASFRQLLAEGLVSPPEPAA
jgi:nucleoside-diphosphate-sugar epimerase